MSSETHGSILLTTADKVSRTIMKKTGSQTGYKPSEWADEVNLMGLLPIRTASGSIAHFEDGADDVPCVSVVANIVPYQEGTGDPSQSNKRPIHGHTACEVTQQGANLFDYSNLQTGYRVVWGTGADYADASASRSDYILVKEGARLRFTASVYVLGYDAEKTYLGAYIDSTQSWLKQSGSLVDDVTIPKGTAYIKIMDFGSISGTITSAFVVNYGATQSTDTTYRTARSYTKALGRTVYGGSAEVVGGTGEETHELITLDGSEAWQVIASGANKRYTLTLSGYTPNNAEISDMFEYSPTNTGNFGTFYFAQGILRIPDGNDTFATLADFKQWLSENTPSFLLQRTTSSSFTFTGQPINSYLGVNNIWADTGDTEVEYRADIDLLLTSLQGNRGLQMTRSTPPVEEEQTEEVEENEDER